MSIRLTITGLATLLVLAACGGSSNDASGRPPSTPSDPPPPTPPAARADDAAKDATPLSDLITLNIKTNTKENIERFAKAFMTAKVGVLATVPKGAAGTQVAGKGEIALGPTRLPDGRIMILAAADPPAFERRFGRPFNAEMDGLSVMKTVLLNPACEGILVNSAASEHSMILERALIQQLVESAPGPQGAR